jgi:hypothetical protein
MIRVFIPDPDPDFLPILDPGSRGRTKGTGFGSATLPTGMILALLSHRVEFVDFSSFNKQSKVIYKSLLWIPVILMRIRIRLFTVS